MKGMGMLEEAELNKLRNLNLGRLIDLFDKLSSITKSKTAVKSFDELSDLVNVSVQGINLETDIMPYKYITVIGTKMGLPAEEEIESISSPENKLKKHKNKKDKTKKPKPAQIFHLGAKDKLSLELKRDVLEFVYRWKLEHTFKMFEMQQLDLNNKIQKAVSFTGEANA